MALGRPKVALMLTDDERVRLESLAHRSRTAPHLARRARIILACAEGLDSTVVARRLRMSPTTVWKWRGTHKGEFMGAAPTGKSHEMMGTTTFRCVNGEITEGWWHFNVGELQRQMGATGSPYES